jgi:hypothetical protein
VARSPFQHVTSTDTDWTVEVRILTGALGTFFFSTTSRMTLESPPRIHSVPGVSSPRVNRVERYQSPPSIAKMELTGQSKG